MMESLLTVEMLLNAYSQGIFPMGVGGELFWFDPDPRAIIPLDSFHIPRTLARKVRRGEFDIKIDTSFGKVVAACAEPGPGREETWINKEICRAYKELHALGFAHSIETWREGKLVGGLYGVSLRGLFAGESMFSRERDASKVALVYLVSRLRAGGFSVLDVQFLTEHLSQFGAVEISQAAYRKMLSKAMAIHATF